MFHQRHHALPLWTIRGVDNRSVSLLIQFYCFWVLLCADISETFQWFQKNCHYEVNIFLFFFFLVKIILWPQFQNVFAKFRRISLNLYRSQWLFANRGFLKYILLQLIHNFPLEIHCHYKHVYLYLFPIAVSDVELLIFLQKSNCFGCR